MYFHLLDQSRCREHANPVDLVLLGCRLHQPLVLAIICVLALTGCSRPTTLETLEQEQVLHVVTRQQPSSYYEDRDGPAGMEYDLAKALADELNVELRLRFEDSPKALQNIIENGFAYFAMAGIGITDQLKEQFWFSSPYMEVTPTLLYRKGTLRPRKPDDLAGKTIHVVADTHNVIICEDLVKTLVDANCELHKDSDTAELMGQIEDESISYVLVDSNELALYQALFPHAKEGFKLDRKVEIAWLLPRSEDDSFLKVVNRFIEEKKQDGTLQTLYDHYYGHITETNYVGARTFIRHIDSRLPGLIKHFKKTAETSNLDWRLLAAMAYQESHWNPKAKSPTGVRGLMMLTQATAKEMKVKNRLDPAQSIEGGAKYFLKVHRKIPSRIVEPDRTWFALAAYNIGYGHLEDARILTQRAGKNPDSWQDVSEFLPRLSKKKWYSQTRHGFARGKEPVQYVQNIRRYYETLVWMDTTKQNEVIAADIPAPDNHENEDTTATISNLEPALRQEDAPPTL